MSLIMEKNSLELYFYNRKGLCILFICMCLISFLYVRHVCAGVSEGQKRELDTLEGVTGHCELPQRC